MGRGPYMGMRNASRAMSMVEERSFRTRPAAEKFREEWKKTNPADTVRITSFRVGRRDEHRVDYMARVYRR